MPMAYRVEYPPYKVQLNEAGKITGFHGGAEDDTTISISFVTPDHSEYFARERNANPYIRVVEFEITQDCWDAIDWKATGKTKKADVKSAWVDRVEKLKSPSWSDGASLSKFIKQTALTLSDGWLDVLLLGVVKSRKASVTFPGDDESGWTDDTDVWAYLDDDPAEGWAVRKGDETTEGVEFMTIAKATRLGYKTR